MKKILVSILLAIFMMTAFYPVIYATENKMENEAQQEEQKNEDSENKVENTDSSEKKESEEEIPEVQENVTKPENITEEEPQLEEVLNNTTTKAPAKVQQRQTYIGKMYIDDPKDSQTFTVPNSKTVTVKGWAVSTDSQPTLKAYIDDEFVKTIENRKKREDVDKSNVVSGYGGTATTPKAGFEENLDISALQAGSHTIKIEQLSRDGDVLSTKSTKITIKVGTFKGKMNIEVPANNKSFSLPNTKTVTVKGWAVSNDSKATLKLYVDNKFVQNIDKRITRGDVNKAVSGSYGGTTATPKAGFEASVNVSKLSKGNHKIKVEERARNGAIICKQEITINIKQEKYTGKMYIETPNNNQSFTLPNSNKIAVRGWAVSTDSEATLKLYVNNKFVQNIDKRITRGDVNKAVSGSYGGTTATPKAGFGAELDISSLKVGSNTIKVEEVSRFGAVICKEERKINIKQKRYTGKMYIETPTNNQSFTLPNSNKIAVRGWAVSTDSEATLKLYVNNKFVQNIDKRITRGDVNKAVSGSYGGTTATPKAGFEAELNISKFAEGTHTIKVVEVSRFGTVICKEERKINIKQKRYTGKMYIETPNNNQSFTLPNSNKIAVRGWAVSTDSEATLKLYVNNKFVQNINKRTTRGDVNKAVSGSYGGTAATPKAGFETTLNISTFAEGTHTIKVVEVSRFGKSICSTSTKIKVGQVRYKGRINIESYPILTYDISKKNIMSIKGWAVSNDPSSYMIIRIDGVQIPCSVARSKRSDVDRVVSGSYGGTTATPKAGFTITANIAKYKEGMHTVEVCEVSRFHKVVASSKIQLKIVTPNYTGIMNLESPIRNKRYRSGWLEVTGWAITECSGDFIKVYLDGQYHTNAQKTKRPDVLAVYGNKYPNHNEYAGFISSINTNGLAEGTHILKVEHCSKYGKTIEVTEVPFTISNTTTWGIDVSHHQGNINWNAVKNQGVNFAILKIGEYRESSGRIIADDYFEQNYLECKRLGIAVGGYFYSYAFNPTEAAHEADACTALIRGKSFEMPIFFDIEDHIVTDAVNSGRTNRDNLTNAVITFCDIMNARGYKSGVYSYRDFFYSYLNMGVLERYNVWLAHYVNSTNYSGRYDMWQYTSSGSVPGINGPVDLNWCFRRYY